MFDSASFFVDPVTVMNTAQATSTSTGAIQVSGGLGVTKAAHFGESMIVQGNVVVGGNQLILNQVNISPSLGDIISERERVLSNSVSTATDVSNFYFTNSLTASFVATVTVDVDIPQQPSKNAMWELKGILVNDQSWQLNTMFTGDLTGVDFFIADKTLSGINIGQVQYKNSNASGVTTIRYRATTVSPTGAVNAASPVSTGNLMGASYTLGDVAFTENAIVFADSNGSITTNTEVRYSQLNNVVSLGSLSKMVLDNTTDASSASSGTLVVSGGAGIGKSLYIGQDLHIAGNIYQNGESSQPFTITGGNLVYTSGSLVLSNVSAGSIVASSITAGNINFTGSLNQNGSEYFPRQVFVTRNNETTTTAQTMNTGENVAKFPAAGDTSNDIVYNTVTGTFTVNKTGLYQVFADVDFYNAAGAVDMYILKNGSAANGGRIGWANFSYAEAGSVYALVYLQENDYIQVMVNNSGSAFTTPYADDKVNSFAMKL